MPWYSFTPTLNPSEPANPNEYTLLGAVPSCPGNNNFLCAIQANDNMGQPIIDAALLAEISLALQNRIDRTNVKLKP
ncbi:hypothetical protein [Sphingobacterium sp. UDSM-2020]|uniref:hypothetical protein n=1 Tax=Sphingobacterium sp. UDSM-2020 TaxID=2795738 RepID=UPI00193866B2|nr:hypothetical protein [Sphingobacterium sp. UDSM-2020]QQD16041.1 hypothetical protein JAZ75_11195 [Sphingobacterium sp. UDSM-2020]